VQPAACTSSDTPFTEKSSRVCTIFAEASQHGRVNPAHVHDSRSGFSQHVVDGAILPSRIADPRIADTRVGATRVQPDWIGCDLRSYRLRLAETAGERMAACRLTPAG
jgi:hypothetical protein